MDNDSIKFVIESAVNAKDSAYAPYSGFRVGAAIQTEQGEVYNGSNVENVSYGLSICAERVALFKAVSEGYKRFVRLGVSTDKSFFITPCGACLQVLREFCEDLDIILINHIGDYKTRKLEELLPEAFDNKML